MKLEDLPSTFSMPQYQERPLELFWALWGSGTHWKKLKTRETSIFVKTKTDQPDSILFQKDQWVVSTALSCLQVSNAWVNIRGHSSPLQDEEEVLLNSLSVTHWLFLQNAWSTWRAVQYCTYTIFWIKYRHEVADLKFCNVSMQKLLYNFWICENLTTVTFEHNSSYQPEFSQFCFRVRVVRNVVILQYALSLLRAYSFLVWASFLMSFRNSTFLF